MHAHLPVCWAVHAEFPADQMKKIRSDLSTHIKIASGLTASPDCDIHLTQKCLQIRTEITGGGGKK